MFTSSFYHVEEEDETLLESDEEEENQSEQLSSDVEEDTEKPEGKVLGNIKPLSEEAIKAFNDKVKRTGVVKSVAFRSRIGLLVLDSFLHDLPKDYLPAEQVWKD